MVAWASTSSSLLVGELRQHFLSETEHAESARHVDGRASVADRATLIPEQHEMPVCQPA